MTDNRIQQLKKLGYVDNGGGKLVKHYDIKPFITYEQLEKLDDDMFNFILGNLQDLDDDAKMYDGDVTG